MKKNYFTSWFSKYLTLSFLLFFLVSCSNQEYEKPVPVEWEKEISGDNLLSIEDQMVSQGLDLESLSLKNNQEFVNSSTNPSLRTAYFNPFLKSIKVTYQIPHPDRSGTMITCSGVVLVPVSKSKTYRVLFSSPPTFTLNSSAASNFFEKFSLSIPKREHEAFYLYLLALQAMKGFAVVIPDYPGYGESYQKCFHPYLVKDVHLNSSIQLLAAAKTKLSSLGYKFKDEIIVSGYSQGALVSSQFVRELETNPAYSTKVLALASGGTPALIQQIVTKGKSQTSYPLTFLFPIALHGFFQNNRLYPGFKVTSMLKEPYASNSLGYFNGKFGFPEMLVKFPITVSKLLTPEFIALDIDTFPFLKQLFDETSLHTWKNKCDFRLYHGKSDNIVFYDQAFDYAYKHNADGGNVEFIPFTGEHITGTFIFYVKSSSWFDNYK